VSFTEIERIKVKGEDVKWDDFQLVFLLSLLVINKYSEFIKGFR